MDSGSLLGAVKLNNFIPWDIDGDIYISTEDMIHFQDGGMGRFILEQEGISMYGWSEDNYWDKGAGHFQLSYQGLEFELMGKKGNLTLNPGEMPTLVPFGDTWAPAHAHPGQYLRGRYGPKYLRHAQSWQFVNMANAFDRSSSRHVSRIFSKYESTNFFYQILCNICFDFLKCSKLKKMHYLTNKEFVFYRN